MSEEQVVRHCAPTLAGLKTGSMFGAWYPSARACGRTCGGGTSGWPGKACAFCPCGTKTAGR